jgi:hypothetical protein
MANPNQQASPLPQRVMGEVYWAFTGSPFARRREFDAKVREYQIAICGEDTWRPKAVVIPAGRIVVQYRCWEGDELLEPVVPLVADNGASFTAGEVLFKLHNAVVEQLRGIAHHFFEGLSLVNPQGPGGAPLYLLRQGS